MNLCCAYCSPGFLLRTLGLVCAGGWQWMGNIREKCRPVYDPLKESPFPQSKASQEPLEKGATPCSTKIVQSSSSASGAAFRSR
ncbi:hypothetical protein VNO78_06878 [Psophocarpus tetragonolobus]|uniref:Secreted protein n=1 Tax=Psophocarpus tetragonolobus TaxID=3891 RepID=A0AAN9SUQ5_PSOTE